MTCDEYRAFCADFRNRTRAERVAMFSHFKECEPCKWWLREYQATCPPQITPAEGRDIVIGDCADAEAAKIIEDACRLNPKT